MKKLMLMLLFLTVMFVSCSKKEPKVASNQAKQYTVKRLSSNIKIDANWDKPAWAKIKAQSLDLFMGDKPQHMPKTQFKVAYDDQNIYVIFKVDDQYVRAVAEGYQSSVCLDSCAEFFFNPSTDIDNGYFNVEINCGGTMLLCHQLGRGKNIVPVENEDLDKIEIAHSLPIMVTEEITEPTTWTLEYRIPVSMLTKYSKVTPPAPGVNWKANFYKCGDKTSQPHWLTWNLVDRPQPDFHVPEFFGDLIFE